MRNILSGNVVLSHKSERKVHHARLFVFARGGAFFCFQGQKKWSCTMQKKQPKVDGYPTKHFTTLEHLNQLLDFPNYMKVPLSSIGRFSGSKIAKYSVKEIATI